MKKTYVDTVEQMMKLLFSVGSVSVGSEDEEEDVVEPPKRKKVKMDKVLQEKMRQEQEEKEALQKTMESAHIVPDVNNVIVRKTYRSIILRQDQETMRNAFIFILHHTTYARLLTPIFMALTMTEKRALFPDMMNMLKTLQSSVDNIFEFGLMDTRAFADAYGPLLMALPNQLREGAPKGAFAKNTGIYIKARIDVDVSEKNADRNKDIVVLSRCDLSFATVHIHCPDAFTLVKYSDYSRWLLALGTSGGCKRFAFIGLKNLGFDVKKPINEILLDVEYVSCGLSRSFEILSTIFHSIKVFEALPRAHETISNALLLHSVCTHGVGRVDLPFGEENNICFDETIDMIAPAILNNTDNVYTNHWSWSYLLGDVRFCCFYPGTNSHYGEKKIKKISKYWDRSKPKNGVPIAFPVKHLFLTIAKSTVIQVDETTKADNLPILAQIAIQLFKPTK
jgi:hypothetical protein